MPELSGRVEAMLDDAVQALQQSLPAGIELASSTQRRTRGFVLDLNASCSLHFGRAIDISQLAVEHAANPAEYVVAVLEQDLKPFRDTIQRAAHAAAAAWRAEIDKSLET